MPSKAKPLPPASSKVMKVNLWLRVENNNKFIRGKKKVRQEIEDRVLSRYQMKKDRPDGWEYELTIPYETDEDLDAAIYDDILHEATWIAESRYCFIETDFTAADDPDRSWRTPIVSTPPCVIAVNGVIILSAAGLCR
jgi:hypothetical protein